MQFREKSKKRVIINITSLVDVLFLLLIFFIVSSTFVEQPGMKLDLPKSSQSEAVRMEGYTLFIASDESMTLNEESVTLENLTEKLTPVAAEMDEEGLVLKADEGVRYGLVVEVMDIAKESGVNRLVVATKPKEK